MDMKVKNPDLLCRGESMGQRFKRLLQTLNPITGKGSNRDAASYINEQLDEIRQAGTENGIHYTETPDIVRELKREGKHEQAIQLLLESVDLTEKEAQFAGEGWGVAPWYYEQLAILYRKQKKYNDEVAILERYDRQPKARGVMPKKLAERLIKARLLAKKAQ